MTEISRISNLFMKITAFIVIAMYLVLISYDRIALSLEVGYLSLFCIGGLILLSPLGLLGLYIIVRNLPLVHSFSWMKKYGIQSLIHLSNMLYIIYVLLFFM